MANPVKIIKNGIIDENPTFMQVIGMCPTLAVTSSAINGIGMGLGYTFSLLLISFVREFLATASWTITNPFNNQVILHVGLSFLEPFKISMFSTSTGAFLTFACFAALFAVLKNKPAKKEKKEAK